MAKFTSTFLCCARDIPSNTVGWGIQIQLQKFCAERSLRVIGDTDAIKGAQKAQACTRIPAHTRTRVLDPATPLQFEHLLSAKGADVGLSTAQCRVPAWGGGQGSFTV